ncbi:MBOAT, membrane-bound O-acyltransferase family-domain-containing protein [Aspergillus cavernicola]|uniref:MBOAT, membrane-bound O-acyltransferase family-domain-containing protein n=1 Tax=Aspergillus cavernicola TaxID=176166 RepID=A0ABR4J4D5_9EURO
MPLIYWIRRLMSLDLLDGRLTPSSNTPIYGTKSHNNPCQSTRPSSSRWNTSEFYAYYLILVIGLAMLFKTVADISQEKHPTYTAYSHLLHTGWILGRAVDTSDTQYRSFRMNMPYLFCFLVSHHFIRQVHEFMSTRPSISDSTSSGAADARVRLRTRFDAAFGLAFITVLHGISVIRIVLILAVNYAISKHLPRRYIPTATWLFNLSLLLARNLSSRYAVDQLLTVWTLQTPPLMQRFLWLARFPGLMPQWEILFKATILRMISFNMDYYWSLNYSAARPIEKKELGTAVSARDRIQIPACHLAYSCHNYFAYVLYSPLYLSGPILTFNDYIAQCHHIVPSISRARVALYGIRLVLALLGMEIFLHYIYTNAIIKASPNWSIYTPEQTAMLAFLSLKFTWLKLLIIWRFFRFWALLDGIEPPENMIRCMFNNYSILGFWRGWHRSFNRWIVRYLYIPLGGIGSNPPALSANAQPKGPWQHTPQSSSLVVQYGRIFNLFVTFTFAALWHGVTGHLLIWGWLITFFLLPEITATRCFPASKWRSWPTARRILSGMGAGGNILMLIIANLVGFALGLEGCKDMVMGIVGSYSGLGFLVRAWAFFYVLAQIIFEVRQAELRAGINLKC